MRARSSPIAAEQALDPHHARFELDVTNLARYYFVTSLQMSCREPTRQRPEPTGGFTVAELQSLDQAVLQLHQEIEIEAPPEDVFEGMIHRLTDGHRGGEDAPSLPLELERRPGGRWYRDLGDDAGHLWGFVQSYRPPTLLELFGPMFMSYPVSGHMIIRFASQGNGTRLSFQYAAFGLLQEDHRNGIRAGFGAMLASVKEDLES